MSTHQDLAEVQRKREAAAANGYKLVRVHSQGKAPVAANWQLGEQLAALSKITADTANTGMICAGLQVVDIDVDDPGSVDQIIDIVATYLPRGAIIRRRSGSSRLALVYRAQGKPRKRSLAGAKGKIEILGDGQQLVIFGIHPSGVDLRWVRDCSPATVPIGKLPIVTEEQMGAFLDACGAPLGVDKSLPTPGSFPPARP